LYLESFAASEEYSMLKTPTVLLTLFTSPCLFISTLGQSKSDELYPINQDGKEGHIDKTGRIIVKPQFDIAYYFSEGIGLFATVMKKMRTAR
jgi:hypothetical protein